MPSREVGNLAVAAAFALFSAFLFFARDEAGAWRENFLYLPIGGSTAPIASNSEPYVPAVHLAGVNGDGNRKEPPVASEPDDAAAAAAAAAAEAKAAEAKAAAAAVAAEAEAAAAAAAAAAAKAAEPAKAKAAGLAKTPLSPDVRDPATGLVLPRTKQFASSKTGLVCLGVGVRVKSVAFVTVNVYTVVSIARLRS